MTASFGLLRRDPLLARVLSIATILLTFLLPSALSTAHADNWNCGSRIVSTGQTKAEVLLRCGEPTWQEKHTGEHYEQYRGAIIGGSVDYDTWTYNLGPSQLIRILHFTNGELVQIETGSHGFLLEDSSTRQCRPEEIHEGMDKFAVWARCGDPLVKDERVEKRVRGSRAEKNVAYVNIAEWTYNFGTQRFMRVLRFENGSLTEIRQIDRGQ